MKGDQGGVGQIWSDPKDAMGSHILALPFTSQWPWVVALLKLSKLYLLPYQ